MDCWEQLAYYILDEADSFGAEHAIQKLREIYVLILEGRKERIRELFEGRA